MPITITVALLTGAAPQPVQLIVNGIPTGTTYEITGLWGEITWAVPGGVGVGQGTQIVLTDARSPLDTPIVYQVTTATETAASTPIAVPYPRSAILQSLDARTSVHFDYMVDGMPRNFPVNAAFFDIDDRARPAMHYATGGDGGGSMTITTEGDNTTKMIALLKSGKPVVLRTNGRLEDLPAMDTIAFTEARNSLRGRGGLTGSPRTWPLPFVWVDDPDANAVLGAWTWEDFNTIYTGKTWAGFNAEWAGQRWKDFQAYDWGQRL